MDIEYSLDIGYSKIQQKEKIMDLEAAGGIIKIIISIGILFLTIAAVIMPLVILAINSKLNRIIKLLQNLNEKT